MNNSLNTMTPEKSLDAKTLREAACSKNTRIAYEKAWKCFVLWCESEHLTPREAKPDDIVRFLIAMAGKGRSGGKKPLALNTLRLYRSGLNDQWHRMSSSSPGSAKVVDDAIRGLARLRGDKPRRVKALREHQIVAMLKSCGEGLHGLRDAAMLSLGYAAALRRSELCHLQTDDLEYKGPGEMMVHVRQSKTDRKGTGQCVAVIEGRTIKPITRVQRWLAASNISRGFVFQTLLRDGVASGNPLDPGDVARIIKRHVFKIGLNPQSYSGHSLRAGFVTSAAAHHARIDKIMEITRHKNAGTLLKYIRDEELFVDHAGASFL